jgi:DNA-binding Lrp family transcriptional regulator
MKFKAYVLIQAEKGQSDKVSTELSSKEGILTVDRVFGEFDLVAVIEALDLQGLVVIVRNVIAPSPLVTRTETLVVTPKMSPQRRKTHK